MTAVDEKIFEELQNRIEGTVLANDVSRALYSSGASLYRVRPQGIIQPKTKNDIVETLKFARRHNIPVTPRGAGSSRVGNELGSGILLDFSRYMNKIIAFDPKQQSVRIQPGIVLAELNRQIKTHNLYFPIDPSTKDWCTLGGMIANNSSGPHAVKYGTTRRHVLSLELVLPNGEIMETGPVALDWIAEQSESTSETHSKRIYIGISDILSRYPEALEKERPFATKNSCGYHVWDLVKDDIMDITPLMVGSEGTLAIVTEALLQLSPIPEKAWSGLVYFDNLDTVGEATQQILEVGPSMLDIMEQHILDLAREQKPEIKPYLPEGTEAVLFIEFQEETDKIIEDKFAQVRNRLSGERKLAIDVKIAENHADMATFATVRSISGPILNKMKGPKRPLAFIEDAAVHPSRLPQYISGLRKLFKQFDVQAAIYGHAGDGNLHNMVILDLSQEVEVSTMIDLAEAVYDLVLDLKGTISGEHADGRLRTYYVQRQYPELYSAMKEIKQVFDPDTLLNPGVIISGDENTLAKSLKYGPDQVTVETRSRFDAPSLQEQIEACSGCGKCRSYCAIATETLEEWSKSRGKITLLREILSGHLDPAILKEPRFKKIMDSCINCKRCLTECPSGVDMPWLAVSSRVNQVEANGEAFSSRVLTDTRRLCEAGSLAAPLVDLANSLPPVRWGLEKLVGVERQRRLPEFHRRTLRKMLHGRTDAGSGKAVAYFLNCYSNYNDPHGEGAAVVEIMKYNGLRLSIPEVKCCGIARINAGAENKILEDIRFNVEQLATYTERGVPIVFSEPSCALAVKMEYPRILNTDLSRKVAENCYEIHEYLMMLHHRGELNLDFAEMDISVGYHHPCHLRILGVTRAPIELLQLIPGVRVTAYSDKCCGMGGIYGLKKENYDLSMKIGDRLFSEIKTSAVDRVATGCSACGLQILQGTDRSAVHPITLLASAYRKAAENGKASRPQPETHIASTP